MLAGAQAGSSSKQGTPGSLSDLPCPLSIVQGEMPTGKGRRRGRGRQASEPQTQELEEPASEPEIREKNKNPWEATPSEAFSSKAAFATYKHPGVTAQFPPSSGDVYKEFHEQVANDVRKAKVEVCNYRNPCDFMIDFLVSTSCTMAARLYDRMRYVQWIHAVNDLRTEVDALHTGLENATLAIYNLEYAIKKLEFQGQQGSGRHPVISPRSQGGASVCSAASSVRAARKEASQLRGQGPPYVPSP